MAVNGETVVTRTPEETLRRASVRLSEWRMMFGSAGRNRARTWVGGGGAESTGRRGVARRRKRRRKTDEWSLFAGVQCDTCDVNPVRGTRYKSVAHDDV